MFGENKMNKSIHVFRGVAASILGAAVVSLSATAWAGAGHGASGKSSIGMPGNAANAARTIHVDLEDNFYNHDMINVKQGETVRFVLKNTGDVLHEFSIGTPNMHVAHQKKMEQMAEHGMLTVTGMATEMPKMDHGKMGSAMSSMMKHDDPNSVLVEPGKTKELTWTFGKAQELEFACNIPGHYDSGMVGKFRMGH